MDKDTFSANLLKAREAAGLSQGQLAEKANCTQAAISNYENPMNPKLPYLNTAASLANALGVSLDSLCGEDEKTREITAFQWLCYLDKLLSNPPLFNGKKSICLRQSENGTAEIVFSEFGSYGAKINDFFRKYSALREVQDAIGEDAYDAARKSLFEKYEKFFCSGVSETTIGAETPTPPIYGYG
ncbi:MAG: helix-turn-helix transcriptional regulator [Ruminococcaceae bacterium]|nr:helix-turn-helix transcriptional regulator [Oscillospiraceae bacterium]